MRRAALAEQRDKLSAEGAASTEVLSQLGFDAELCSTMFCACNGDVQRSAECLLRGQTAIPIPETPLASWTREEFDEYNELLRSEDPAYAALRAASSAHKKASAYKNIITVQFPLDGKLGIALDFKSLKIESIDRGSMADRLWTTENRNSDRELSFCAAGSGESLAKAILVPGYVFSSSGELRAGMKLLMVDGETMEDKSCAEAAAAIVATVQRPRCSNRPLSLTFAARIDPAGYHETKLQRLIRLETADKARKARIRQLELRLSKIEGKLASQEGRQASALGSPLVQELFFDPSVPTRNPTRWCLTGQDGIAQGGRGYALRAGAVAGSGALGAGSLRQAASRGNVCGLSQEPGGICPLPPRRPGRSSDPAARAVTTARRIAT